MDPANPFTAPAMPTSPVQPATRRCWLSSAVAFPPVSHQELVTWRSLAVLLVALAAIIGLRLHTWHLALDADEANYMLFARFWSGGWGRLYDDLWDNKPLGTFLLFRGGTALWGYHEWTPRLMSLLAMLLSTGCLWWLLGRLGPVAQGLALLLVWVPLTCHVPSQATGANIEVFLLPFVLGAWCLLARYQAHDRAQDWWGAMGLLVTSLLLKPVTLPFLAAAFVVEWPHGRRSWRRLLVRAVATAVLVIVAHLALYGACGYRPRQLLTQWRESARYSVATRDSMAYRLTAGIVALPLAPAMAGAQVLAVVGAAGLIGGALCWRRRQDWLLVLGAFAAATAVVLPGANQMHYYILLLPFVALGTAVWLAAAARSVAVFVVALGLAALTLPPLWTQYLAQSPLRISAEQARAEDGTPTAWFIQDRYIGQQLAVAGITGQRIFVDGSHPGVFFYSANVPALRFHVAWDEGLGVTTHADRMAALRAHPPPYIVLLDPDVPLALMAPGLAQAYVEAVSLPPLAQTQVLRRRD